MITMVHHTKFAVCDGRWNGTKPCVHRGKVNGQDVLFLRQVDDFACGVDSQETHEALCDLLDARLLEPIKRMGLIDCFNGVNVEQTADYIKLSSTTYIDKILQQHDFGELHHTHNRPIPMNETNEYCRKLDTAVGPATDAERTALAERMTFSYRQGIGELIWAMITCRPDILFATVKLSQFAANPAEVHYKAVKDVFRYLEHGAHNDPQTATENHDADAFHAPLLNGNFRFPLLDGALVVFVADDFTVRTSFTLLVGDGGLALLQQRLGLGLGRISGEKAHLFAVKALEDAEGNHPEQEKDKHDQRTRNHPRQVPR